MKHIYKLLILISCFISISHAAPASSTALLLTVNSAIGPATQNYIRSGLAQANRQNAQFVILQLNTSGGLDNVTRNIVQNIVDSPIPVVTYVAPSGAHVASTGIFILYASHLAAMAPRTHLGASHMNMSANNYSEEEKPT